MFSNLRQGSVVYILEKGDKHSLREGQVTAISNQRQKYNNPANFAAGVEMVLDFDAKAGDDTYKFNGVSANSNFAINGNVVVTDSREAMQQEVYNIQQASKQAIESVPYHERVCADCEDIMRQLNPSYAQQQRYDEELATLKSEIGDVKGMLSQLIDSVSKKGK